MPPPPPPSKSYLLTFDSDTDDGSEDDEDRQHHRRRRGEDEPQFDGNILDASVLQRHIMDSLYPTNKNSTNPVQDITNEDDAIRIRNQRQQPMKPRLHSKSSSMDTATTAAASSVASTFTDWQEDDTSSPPSTKNKKRNQKKRNKKKQKKKQQQEERSSRHVHFANVSVLEFPRTFGVDSVPGDGGWPLGMEFQPVATEDKDDPDDPTCLGAVQSIEEYEEEKQNRLKERWEEVKTQMSDSSREVIIPIMESSTNATSTMFETRQWDYKQGVKNPLFRMLLEEERRAIFLNDTSEEGTSNKTKKSGHDNTTNHDSSKRRTRSNSVSTPPTTSSNSNSPTSIEFNKKYDQVTVHHVRNELETLRNSRTQQGGTGCTCRKLVVYLPPKDGSGGKRAQHRRLKPQKLTQELKKRAMYHPKASREELELILYDAIQQESCCGGNDCDCVKNGITCQADTCTCWHSSHLGGNGGGGATSSTATTTTTTTDDGAISVDEISRRCGNPNGMYAVDLIAIDKVRRETLNRLRICPPIVTATGE